VKALEDRKRNIIEYKRFLESCNFIKPNSQWRKVQDRLEVDERCSRLEKIDQLEIFQVVSFIRNYLPIPDSAKFNCCTGVSA
jgi:hypothetical protein